LKSHYVIRSSMIAVLIFLLLPFSFSAGEFKLSDGNRVVFVGSTLIEREQESGYWETALTTRFPKANVTFRNLGWSGDTVFCDARAMFDSTDIGFQHLKDDLERLKPTVIILGYGTNESFDGEVGLPKFKQGLVKLLDMLTTTKARIIILSPPPQERMGPLLPDPAKHNHDLEFYRDILRQEAQKSGHAFVDLFDLLGAGGQKPSVRLLMDNGIHFTNVGYWHTGTILAQSLAGSQRWFVGIDKDATIQKTQSVQISKVQPMPLHFQTHDDILPTPPVPGRISDTRSQTSNASSDEPQLNERVLRVAGLAPGKYVLKIDGREVASASAEEWTAGVRLTNGPEFDQVEKLRQAIIEKNRLFFHRWRPQNETYLFGFRKQEQGKNASEIPEFDPLIAELEKKIAKLRVPVPHQYELSTETPRHREENGPKK